MTPAINLPIKPPNHQTIHQPIGGGVSTDFKSPNRIKIYWFVQVLLNFYWFRGSPRWGWVGWGVKWGFGDDVGMTGMTWGWQGWHGDDRDDMGMMGMTWGRWGRPHPLTPLLTHPSIQPPMNPPMARGVSANHKSSNRIELSWLSQDLFDFLWFDMAPPIDSPIHPTTHTPTHRWGVSPQNINL